MAQRATSVDPKPSLFVLLCFCFVSVCFAFVVLSFFVFGPFLLVVVVVVVVVVFVVVVCPEHPKQKIIKSLFS